MQTQSPFNYSWAMYVEKQWNVFDLPHERKDPPRTGTTGYKAEPLSVERLTQIAEQRGAKNIGLRTPTNVIGIDVDHGYVDDDGEQKTGLDTLQKLEERLGKLPETFVSTSRDIRTGSGIRFYRVPEGLEWSDPGKDIETVWWGHRYAVVWPSKHPSGGCYKWYSSDGSEALPPEVAQLPELPDAWVQFMQRREPKMNERQGGIDFSDEAHVENHVNYALSRLEEADGEYHKLIYLVSAALTASRYAHAHANDEEVSEDELHYEIGREVLKRTPWQALDHRDHRWITDGIRKNRDSYIINDELESDSGRITEKSSLEDLVEAAQSQSVPIPDGNPKQEHGIAAREIARVLNGSYCFQEGIGWMQWTGTHWASRCPTPVREAVATEAQRQRKKATNVLSTLSNNTAVADAYSERARMGMARGGTASGGPSEEEQELTRKITIVENWKEKWEALIQWWNAVTSGYHYSHIMDFAAVDSRIYTQHSDFDADQTVLNVANGTVDLTTGELRKHNPDDRISKVASNSYHKGMSHSSLSKALEAEHPDIREWLQIRRGAMLFGGENREETIMFNFGKGANGKSTITNAMLDVLGDYAVALHDKALLGSANDHSAEQMIYKGARVAVLEELPESQILRPQLVKKLVGTGQITARAMRQDLITFKTTHSIIVNANHQPQVPEQDYGTRRRLLSVPWPFTFRDEGETLQNEFDKHRDKSVKSDLQNDREAKEAVLAYLIEGARKYYENGMSCGPLPTAVQESTEHWMNENDYVKQFLETHCVPDPNYVMSSAEILKAFNDEIIMFGKSTVSEKYLISRVGDTVGFENVEHKQVRVSGKMNLSTRDRITPTKMRGFVGMRWKVDGE